jgi:hypothetical protein
MSNMIEINDILCYILYGSLLYLFLKFQINKIHPTKPKSYKNWLKNLKKSINYTK